MKISVFTSTNASLTKRFEVLGGTLQKTPLANFSAGAAETRDVRTPTELLALLDGLTAKQALAAGVLKVGTSASITTASKARQGGGVARTLEHFHYPAGPGWMLWDFDNKTMPPEVRDRIGGMGGPIAALFYIWPEATCAPYLFRPSSSGGVSAPGIPETQSEGLHGFFLIEDVRRSSEALEVLQARAWAAGLAWCALSKSGAVLIRSIVDVSVGSPERLIFEAPPILIDPVIRTPKPAILSDGIVPVPVPVIDKATAAAAEAAEAKARKAIKPEAARVEAAFVEDRAQTTAEKTGKPIKEARRMVRQMLKGGVLSDDHLLQMRDGSLTRVGDLLDAPERFDRLSLPDPIEGLSYGTDKATLLLLPDPTRPDILPRLVSHAHGMKTVYTFQRYEGALLTPRGRAGQFTGSGAISAAPPLEPVFTPTDQVGQAIAASVGGWLARALSWEAGTAPPPVLALRASPGAGKSRVAREIIGRADLSALAGDVLYHAPTMTLCEEAAAHAIALGRGGHVTRGRSAINPASGLPMCSRSVVAEAVAVAGLPVFATLCAQPQPKRCDASGELQRMPPILCPEYARCAHVAQWSELGAGPVLRFEPSAYLRLAGDGSDREVTLRVIDEGFWQGLIGVSDLTREEWLAPRAVPRGTAPDDQAPAQLIVAALPTAAMEVWRALEQRDIAMLDHLTADQFAEFAEFEDPKPRLASNPEHSDREILNELKVSRRLDQKAKSRSRVWATLRDYRRRGVRDLQCLRLTRQPIPGADGMAFRDVLRVNWREDLPLSLPALLLDADVTRPVLDAIFPWAEMTEIKLQANAYVVQVSDQTLSKRALQSTDKRAEAVSLVRAEVYIDTLAGGRGVLVGAQREVVVWIFQDAGFDFGGRSRAEVNATMRATPLHGARWIWFGPASLGLNTYEDFGTAIILGREELPLQALQDEARSLFGDRGAPLDLIDEVEGANYPEVLLPYLMRDGSGQGVMVRAHPDTRVRALQEQHRERGSVQLIERLRLARAAETKRVIVACKVPLPGLHVDELVRWEDIVPSRLEQAIAEAAQRGGVLRMSAAGLAADAPETFGSVAAAHQWLKSGGKDAFEKIKWGGPGISTIITRPSLFDPISFNLRLERQRGKITPALATLPGDIRAMAEAQFGPVAELRLAEPVEVVSNVILLMRSGKIDLNLWTGNGVSDPADADAKTPPRGRARQGTTPIAAAQPERANARVRGGRGDAGGFGTGKVMEMPGCTDAALWPTPIDITEADAIRFEIVTGHYGPEVVVLRLERPAEQRSRERLRDFARHAGGSIPAVGGAGSVATPNGAAKTLSRISLPRGRAALARLKARLPRSIYQIEIDPGFEHVIARFADGAA